MPPCLLVCPETSCVSETMVVDWRAVLCSSRYKLWMHVELFFHLACPKWIALDVFVLSSVKTIVTVL